MAGRSIVFFIRSDGVTPIMAGEPLLRPKFIHKVIYYGSKKASIMYLPTERAADEA